METDPTLFSELGLRARKKEQTRLRLSETARRLFGERGFERVSVAEIARTADVSEATVFNYFPTKEDLVFAALAAFERELLDAIRGRPEGEPLVAAFSRFVLQPRGLLASQDEKAAAELTAMVRMVASSPALLAREDHIFACYTKSLARLIAEETGATEDDLRPATAAAAIIGVHRAVIDHIRSRILAGNPDLGRLARETRTRCRRALALLEAGFGDYARK